MKPFLTKLFLLSIVTLTLTSCLYRAPQDTDPDVIPVTNNSNLIDKASTPGIPGVAY